MKMLLAVVMFCFIFSTDPYAMELCHAGSRQDTKTCVVDGDTIWLQGVKYRLAGFDTPEPITNLCGGAQEKALAKRASARLLEILNTSQWTISASGELDRYGRGIATIRVKGVDVGDILIDEGLARRWPDGEEWWCR